MRLIHHGNFIFHKLMEILFFISLGLLSWISRSFFQENERFIFFMCLENEVNSCVDFMAKGNFQRQAITLLCKGLYWLIWIERNNMIFNSKTPDWDVIFDLTFHWLVFWLKSSVKNFSYTGSDLYRNSECIMNCTN